MFNRKILILSLIAFLVRLLFASNSLLGTGDSGAINSATYAYLQGEHVYELPSIYLSNPPFSLHVLSYWRILGSFLGHNNFITFWKTFAALFDSLLIVLIYEIGALLWKSKQQAFQASLFYALNPIAIVISSVHGQLESVWIFFTLLAFYLLIRKKKMMAISAIIFGIGISIKMVPLLLLPFIVLLLPRWRQRISYIGIAIVVFLILSYPELYTSFPAVNRQVFMYQSTPWYWGISKIIYQFSKSGLFSFAIAMQLNALLKYFMLGMIGLFWLIVNRNHSYRFLASTLTVLMLFFIFTPGFGLQYILWPVPFLILTKSNFLRRYLFLGSLIMLSSYDIGIMPISYPFIFLNNNVFNHTSLTVTDFLLYLLWGMCVLFFLKKYKRILKNVSFLKLKKM